MIVATADNFANAMLGVSGFLVRSDGSVLMMKRKGSHGEDTYANPGGHIEDGETEEDALDREILEETGIDISELSKQKMTTTHDDFGTKQYKTAHYLIEIPDDVTPENREPEKCEELRFYLLKELIDLYESGNLFLPMHNVLESYENLRGHRPTGFCGVMEKWFSKSAHYRKIWLFCGPAGSGKGTQGKILETKLKVSHTSTGEILRRIASGSTDHARKIARYMDTGEILPPDMAFPIFTAEFSKLRYQIGFILDGYPKDTESLQFLMRTASAEKIEIQCVFYFDMAYELNRAVRASACIPQYDRTADPTTLRVLSERLTTRILCSKCETNYHPMFNPPKIVNQCDRCQNSLTSRTDDQDMAVIERRIQVFCDSTLKVLDEFAALKIPIHRIDACLPVNTVTCEIKSIITNNAT